jgi:hypothetical protein
VSNGVGISRAERRDILLERIAQTKSLITAHEELAELIVNSEARSVAHKHVWDKVAHRLRMDAKELQLDLEHNEQRLADITVAQQAFDSHTPHVDRPSRITVT